MKKLLLLTFLFCISLTVFAQQNEAVYLKNGSVIKGTIIEQIPNESLKIETSDGSIFVYKMEEVAKITKETSQNKGQANQSRSNSVFTNGNGRTYDIQGYRGFVDFGYTVGVGDFATGRVELTTSHGYQINPYIFIGGGTGFQFYHEAESVVLPLFADFRANFTNGHIVPFVGIKLGYSFDLSDSFSGLGFYLNPAVGVKFMLSDKQALNLSIGYTMQSADAYYYSSGYFYSSTENMGGISFKVGFEF